MNQPKKEEICLKKFFIITLLFALLTLPLLCKNVSALVPTEIVAKFSDIYPQSMVF